ASDERSAPFFQSRFTVVNLLSSTYESNNHGPICVSLHDSQQHFWLRVVPLEFLHVLGLIPRTLRLVKDNGVIRRWPQIVLGVVTREYVDILYESFGL